MPTPKLVKARVLQQKTYSSRRPERYAIPWTPDLLRAAKVQAEWGYLRLAGDLYVDLLGEDDRHHGTLASVAQSVLTLPVSFDADGDRRRKSKIEQATEEDFSTMIPLCEAVTLISHGISLGVGVAQLVPWEQSEGGRLTPRLKVWEPRNLRYDYENQTWLIQLDEGVYQPITPGDGQWALFTPWGYERPWSKGTWRACSQWALLKHYARRDWARQGELAGGIRTAETPDGAKDSDRRALAHDLEDIGADAVLIPPPGYKPAILQAAANTYQTFEKQIQLANAAIAVANKGESLTSGTDGQSGLGGAGLGKVHQQVSDQRVFFIAQAWQEFLYEQILAPYAKINFGLNAPIPRACYQIESEEDLATKAARWQATANAIGALRGIGLPVDAEAVAAAGKIPLLAPEAPDPFPAPEIAPDVPSPEDAAITLAEKKRLKVQTILVLKEVHQTLKEATALVKKHGFSTHTHRETDTEWRFRQRPPTDFKKPTYQWHPLEKGVVALWAELKDDQADTHQPNHSALLTIQHYAAPIGEGIMLALYPTPEVAALLYQPDGEAPEELHVTLCYLGRTPNFPAAQLAQLRDVAARVASRTPILRGEIEGFGFFEGEHARVLWAALSAPGINELQAAILAELTAEGIATDFEHSFTPHLTLAYLDPEAPRPEPTIPRAKLLFSELHLVIGTEHALFPFSV